MQQNPGFLGHFPQLMQKRAVDGQHPATDNRFDRYAGQFVGVFPDHLESALVKGQHQHAIFGAGGNTGSQAATLVIRGLALGDVKPGDILKILFKELKVSLMLGVLLGLMAYGRVLIFGGGSTLPSGFSLALVGFSIAVALGFQVISSTLIGAMLPLAAARFKLDPAVVATPALTTIVDMTGLLIYFTTVKLILGI